eukprot:168336-Prymnesium_polylepis.2
MTQQQLQHFDVPATARQQQRRRLVGVSRLRVCAAFQQELRDLCVSVVGDAVQRCVEQIVALIEGATFVESILHREDAPFLRRLVYRDAAASRDEQGDGRYYKAMDHRHHG